MCIFVVKKTTNVPLDVELKIWFLSKHWPKQIKGNCYCFSCMQLLKLIPLTALSNHVY